VNYLQLAQKLHLILRIGEETPGTQPASVTGTNTGAVAEIVQWVKHSTNDIIGMQTEWDFLRASGSLLLASGGRVLTAAAIKAQIADLDIITPFTGSDGAFLGITPTNIAGAAEMRLALIPVGQWYGQYDMPPLPTGQPCYATLNPDGSLECDAIADQDYTIRCNYAKAASDLANDSDVPIIPARYHNAIVWWAAVNYYCGTRDEVSEFRQKADLMLKRELVRLYNEQLPDFTL
jgi:hypothetical protein